VSRRRPGMTVSSPTPQLVLSTRITHSESTSTPSTATPHFVKGNEVLERGRIAQRHEDDTMMRKGAHGRKCGTLLASSLRGSRDEETGVLAPVATGLPLLAGRVPEGLPLGGEVAVTGGDAEEEGVVFLELLGGDERDGVGLTGSVHLAEDFLRESLFDSGID